MVLNCFLQVLPFSTVRIRNMLIIQNLLLDADGNVRISDFGLATLYVGDNNAEGDNKIEVHASLNASLNMIRTYVERKRN